MDNKDKELLSKIVEHQFTRTALQSMAMQLSLLSEDQAQRVKTIFRAELFQALEQRSLLHLQQMKKI